MTTDEWESICFLIEEWWPPSPAEGEFDDARRRAWRLALDGFAADAIAAALRALLARGGKWRPRPSEVIAEIRKDPSKPTFEEAYRLIFGRGGALKARPPRGQTYANEAAMIGAHDDAAQARAWELHPLVGSFVERYGVRRLATLEIDHPEYGELKRRELREAWDRHCEAMDGRDVAALAAGRRRGELAAFDPLAAIKAGAHQVKRAELGRG